MFNWLGQLFAPKNVNKYAIPGTTLSVYGSSSGIAVTPEASLKLGAVYRAVDLISSAVGKMPLHLYRDADGYRQRITDDDRARLVRREVSPGISAADFFQSLTAAAVLQGNGYGYIRRDEAFRPVELWVLPPQAVQPRRVDGVVDYLVELNDKYYSLPYYDVIHLRGMGMDALRGLSVVQYMADDAGLALAMRENSGEFFKNYSAPDLIVSPKDTLGREEFELLANDWRNANGAGERHKVRLTQAALNVQPITISARDAQLVEARAQSIREIANWFGVPPHKLGDTSRTSYNSIEAENMSFLSDCLDKWLVKLESELWGKLLTEDEKRRGDLWFEFKRDSWLNVDTKTRYEVLLKATGSAPIMTQNEARKIENLPPVEGGDVLLSPLNMKGTTDGEEANPTAE